MNTVRQDQKQKVKDIYKQVIKRRKYMNQVRANLIRTIDSAWVFVAMSKVIKDKDDDEKDGIWG